MFSRPIAFVLLTVFWPCVVMADETLSLANTVETFKDEFKQAPHWREGGLQVDEPIKSLSDPSFTWAAGYLWNHALAGAPQPWPPSKHDFPAWTSNSDADADPNGDMIAKIDKKNSPLTWSGTLNFTAREMPAALVKTIDKDPHGYMGASIISFPYAQRYGVFAITAKLPRGKGVWPAFWLVPADKSWPPEIDIFEVLGADPTTFYTTVHTNETGTHTSKGQPIHTQTDLGADFHEYALDWGPDQLRWYFDRKLVFSQPTPSDLHKPCYIITNLAIGKTDNWGGAPDASVKFPVTMQVSSIRVWQRPDYQKKTQ